MAIISLSCKCGKKLRANPELAGMKGRCPNCGCEFVIPKPNLDTDIEADMMQRCAAAAELRRQWEQLGNPQRAETTFREIVTDFPHFWMGHFGLASSLFLTSKLTKPKPDAKKRSEAIVELQKAVQQAKDQREPLLELARHTAKGDIREAERLYQKAMRCDEAAQKPLLPVSWQAENHWKFAIAAAESDLTAVAIEAFCRAGRLDSKRFSEEVSPATTKAKTCWRLALKKLQVVK